MIEFTFMSSSIPLTRKPLSTKMVAKAQQVDAPEAIVLTDKERAAGAYSPRNLQKVLGALHQDGLVVLKDAIDARHIDALNVKMCEDAEEIIADPTKEYNHGVKCENGHGRSWTPG